MQRYIIGKSPMPKWVQGRLMQYRKDDNTTGFEWHFEKYGVWKTVELKRGDILIYDGENIHYERR